MALDESLDPPERSSTLARGVDSTPHHCTPIPRARAPPSGAARAGLRPEDQQGAGDEGAVHRRGARDGFAAQHAIVSR